jgi:hypothetical protein
VTARLCNASWSAFQLVSLKTLATQRKLQQLQELQHGIIFVDFAAIERKIVCLWDNFCSNWAK